MVKPTEAADRDKAVAEVPSAARSSSNGLDRAAPDEVLTGSTASVHVGHQSLLTALDPQPARHAGAKAPRR